MSRDDIKEFWEEQAEKFGTGYEASWQDLFAVNLEIEALESHIPSGKSVLNAGCANAYSFIEQMKEGNFAKATGIDYSEEMITQARKNVAELDKDDFCEIELLVADVRELPFSDGTFDVTYTTRTLINLPTWEHQKKAIGECLRVTKEGGRVIFQEAFWEPLVVLNSLRTVCGLSPLVEHDFNKYLKKSKLETFLRELGLGFKVDEFSSIYYLGTRLLREMLRGKTPMEFTNPFNESFYELELKYTGVKCGIQQAYIIDK